jgi:hypothetical protein
MLPLFVRTNPNLHNPIASVARQCLIDSFAKLIPGRKMKSSRRSAFLTTREWQTITLPFRDVEDTVGTANIAGLLNWLLEKSADHIERSEENALRLGRIAGLISLAEAASRLAVGPHLTAKDRMFRRASSA